MIILPIGQNSHSGKSFLGKKNMLSISGKLTRKPVWRRKRNQGVWCQETELIKNILAFLEKPIQQVSLMWCVRPASHWEKQHGTYPGGEGCWRPLAGTGLAPPTSSKPAEVSWQGWWTCSLSPAQRPGEKWEKRWSKSAAKFQKETYFWRNQWHHNFMPSPR